VVVGEGIIGRELRNSEGRNEAVEWKEDDSIPRHTKS